MVIKNGLPVTYSPTTKTYVFYPETDGMPMPDAYYQSKHFLGILPALKLYFASRDDVVISGNIFIYYEEGDNQRRVVPDCFVVLGVGKESFERNNTYLMWDVGKQPDFVLEIGSPATARTDLTRKRDLYARLGIGEYWRFDPSGGEHYNAPLVGERLVDGEYREFRMNRDEDGGVWGYSPALNLELRWVDGRLRFYDPAGDRWLQNMEETDAAREFERERADSAEARIAEMEAELRRLRGE